MPLIEAACAACNHALRSFESIDAFIFHKKNSPGYACFFCLRCWFFFFKAFFSTIFSFKGWSSSVKISVDYSFNELMTIRQIKEEKKTLLHIVTHCKLQQFFIIEITLFFIVCKDSLLKTCNP